MKSPWRLLWSAFWAPIRGRLGEAAVNAGAVLTLPSSVYRRYHNVMLRTVSGTTQIDHVLVSVLGYSWWKRRTWQGGSSGVRGSGSGRRCSRVGRGISSRIRFGRTTGGYVLDKARHNM